MIMVSESSSYAVTSVNSEDLADELVAAFDLWKAPAPSTDFPGTLPDGGRLTNYFPHLWLHIGNPTTAQVNFEVTPDDLDGSCATYDSTNSFDVAEPKVTSGTSVLQIGSGASSWAYIAAAKDASKGEIKGLPPRVNIYAIASGDFTTDDDVITITAYLFG